MRYCQSGSACGHERAPGVNASYTHIIASGIEGKQRDGYVTHLPGTDIAASSISPGPGMALAGQAARGLARMTFPTAST